MYYAAAYTGEKFYTVICLDRSEERTLEKDFSRVLEKKNNDWAVSPDVNTIGIPTSYASSGLRRMMSFVYILKSLRNKQYYIGSTDNLSQRLHDHLKGYSSSTKILLPVELVFQQEFKNTSDARKAETWLKKLKRRDYIEKIIKDKIIKKDLGR